MSLDSEYSDSHFNRQTLAGDVRYRTERNTHGITGNEKGKTKKHTLINENERAG